MKNVFKLNFASTFSKKLPFSEPIHPSSLFADIIYEWL